jgi:hypothetical protein
MYQSSERKNYIIVQLINVHNNHDLPTAIRKEAMKLEMLVNYNHMTDEEMERRYQSLQVRICDHLVVPCIA